MGKQKYKIVSELLDETMREVSFSEENWCRFLTTSSRLYKYPFKEQVLIYAQRPDATACASVEIWNHRMNCWINRGSKGIALIDEDRFGKLKYVFDVSDVHKGRWRGRLPYLWDMKEVHQEPILNHLEELYGKTDETATFVERIRVIADRITEETGRQLFQDVQELKKGSRLAHLDDANLKLRLQLTLSDSVAYSILKRCGISDEVLENTIGFMYIPEFNTADTLLLLGNHVSELTKPVLMEICRCIWKFDREQEKAQKQQRKKFTSIERGNRTISREKENTAQTIFQEKRNTGQAVPGFGKSVETLLAEAESIKVRKEAWKKAQNEGHGESSTHIEKKSNLGLANSPEAHYNALNHESENETENITQQLAVGDERSQNGETGIRTERGLHGTDASDGRTAGGDSDEIRTDETAVPQGTQKRNLHGISAEGDFERTSSDDSGTGRGANGSISGTDGKSGWRDRTPQSGKSDALGTENEQHPSQSRGDSSEGIDLQINNEETTEIYEQMSLFPSFEEQVGTVMAAEADTIHVKPAAFSLSKEQIEEILRSGGGRKDNRKRIYAKYQQGKSPEEIAEFLKNEYGTTGKGFILDNNPIAVWFDESGIRVGYGTSAIENTFLWMSWQEAEYHVRNMVAEGSYMSIAEAFLVDESERLRVANDIYYFFRDGVTDLWERSEYHRNTAPESIQELCSLLSDNMGRQQLFSELEEAWQLLEQGIITKKWNYVKSPQYLMEQIEDLGREKVFYPCADHVEIRNEDFITRDEVNYRLTQGSSFEHGQFRIYEYFTGKHEKHERVDFLKKEYGIGGSSHALPGSDTVHENHDAKGIHLEKGSYAEPYAEVLLNWNVVEKRISELIKAGRYLKPEQMEAYATYKQEKELQIAKSGLVEHTELLQVAQMETPNPIKNDVESMEMENATSLKRYEAIQTDDPYEPTFAVWDNQTEDYYKINEVVWLFDTEIEAIDFAEELNQQELLQTSVTNKWKEKDSLLALHSLEQETHSDNREENFLLSSVMQAENLKDVQTTDNVNQIDSVNQTLTLSSASLQDTSETKAVNFRITSEIETSPKGFAPKEKFHQNMEAIRTLKNIEAEQRIATPEEQEILAKYVGWGGLSDVFKFGNVNWHKEYQELKNLLSPEEYASARESTLNAHYTSPAIIQGIYDVIEKMGFSQGTILEPAMGTGHFFGMLPEQMRQSRLYGVELDTISGRIAKQLYPNANIQISGFEKTDFPNDFFDMAIGNVPFGQYKVSDREYDKYNLSVHDYFLVKSLDKVKPNGIAAFITSKSTMDKRNPTARKLMAQRGELIGAIRLLKTAFKENAGTEVTSDILFFRKHERMLELEPDWVHLSENENGIVMNSYFMEHPERILGRMEMANGPYGKEAVCLPDVSVPLSDQLKKAGAYIIGQTDFVNKDFINRDFADREYQEIQTSSVELPMSSTPKLTEIGSMDVFSTRNENPLINNSIEAAASEIPTNPNVKNYSYAIVQNQVYYRENSIMKRMDLPETTKERIKAMVQMRDCTQELIKLQMEEFPDTLIQGCQAQLNRLYDAFSEKYGLIHSQANKRAFRQDSSYYLLCSLENLDENGNFKGKADMFSKRTIRRAEAVTSVDTAAEALAVSLSEKAGIDLPYMESLTGKGQEEIIQELKGVIFQNPFTEKWETADEYLSGNVRDKLNSARIFAEHDPKYAINVSALEQVQPKELEASEIEVRIGATWIDIRYIEDFMCEVFETPEHYFDRNIMSVQYSDISEQWNIKGKNVDYGNALVNMTYGTSRANAYRILEDSLNLKDVRIFDTVVEDGKEKRILNKKETMLASQKQESIREKFKDWIFQEPKRRNILCKKYNEIFNSTRPREYDGSHLKFPGMTESITLRPHQLNAVAHQIYGNNTLLAHCVGGGKTFEMIAAAMESKRLGLCRKSMFVVPNHLTEQWASDFMRLYPGANILAATKKDFEPANRKKFCSRIATGDFDAVIIGHTQFERIPLSAERQRATIENQIEEIQTAIETAKAEKGENYTIKQMEKTRKQLLVRLEKLSAEEKKDNVVTFEQLGVDRLFVDESHHFKNCAKRCRIR